MRSTVHDVTETGSAEALESLISARHEALEQRRQQLLEVRS